MVEITGDELDGHKARPYKMNGGVYWVAILLRWSYGVKDVGAVALLGFGESRVR